MIFWNVMPCSQLTDMSILEESLLPSSEQKNIFYIDPEVLGSIPGTARFSE
jgi:hypothetical protein